MGPQGSKSIHYRDEPGQNTFQIIIGKTRRVQTQMGLDNLPERLQCLVARKLKPLVLNIHLAESL
jgi:hypothetical protein